jgi:hypothetical protein
MKKKKKKKEKGKSKIKIKWRNKKERLMRPLLEPVTSLDKCRVTFYWVIKCTFINTTQWERRRGVLHNISKNTRKNGGNPVAHACTQGNPFGVTCTNILYYSSKKKPRGIRACAHDHFRTVPLPVMSIPVAHALGVTSSSSFSLLHKW